MSREDDVTALIAACPLFAGAGEDDLRALAAISSSTSWPKGTLIFQQGDAADFLLIVETGRIRLGLTTAAGRELTLRHADHGAVVGEMGVLDHDPRSADATAVQATRCLVIRRAAFERVLAERPGLAIAVIRYLSGRLRETTYQLESVALYELAARLARFLLATLRQVHGADLDEKDHAALTLDLGQSEIAAILGASRPKLNRALANLEEDGAIRRDGKQLVCDIEALQAIAAADAFVDVPAQEPHVSRVRIPRGGACNTAARGPRTAGRRGSSSRTRRRAAPPAAPRPSPASACPRPDRHRRRRS